MLALVHAGSINILKLFGSPLALLICLPIMAKSQDHFTGGVEDVSSGWVLAKKE